MGVLYSIGYLWPLYLGFTQDLWPYHPVTTWISLIVILSGFGIELMARRQLVTYGHFPDAQSTKFIQIVDDQRLVTQGLFKYIRHPLYAGRLFWSVGYALLFSSLLALAFFILGTVFLIFRIRIEENMLFDEFGDEYSAYKQHTHMLIPCLL